MVIVDVSFGVVYMENKLGFGISRLSRFLQKGGNKCARRLMVSTLYVWKLPHFLVWYLFGRGTYNNGNTKVHTDKNACVQ